MIDQFLLLKTLGIPGHHRGFGFLLECLNLSLYDETLLSPITKRLYPLIAERHAIGMLCVERDIRTVVKIWWKRGNRDFITDLIGTIAKPPTNKEFIYLLNMYFTRRFAAADASSAPSEDPKLPSPAVIEGAELLEFAENFAQRHK